MNRGELITLASEIAGLSGNEAMRSSMKAQLAMAAHRAVQIIVSKTARNTMIREDLFTYPAQAVTLDLKSVLPTNVTGTILNARMLGLRTRDEAVSFTNDVQWLDPYPTAMAGRASKVPLSTMDGSGAWSDAVQQGAYGSRIWWMIENGHTLRLNPIPSADQYVVFRWVPLMKFDADDCLVLGGYLPYAEDLVLYKTAEKFASAVDYKDYAMQARNAYDGHFAQLSDFADVMPAQKGSTTRMANRKFQG